MMRIYDEWGQAMPITVLQLEDNIVVEHRTLERDGYQALIVGAGPVKEKHLTKPVIGLYQKNKIDTLKKRLVEFRVTSDSIIPIGSKIEARHFLPGQLVDVAGITIGKGFQGGMKRWGFRGQQESHGTSRSHRSLGSISSWTDGSRTWKGKKMHGHMGVKRKTIQNLLLYAIDPINNRLFVKGHVAGHAGNVVEVYDAVKHSNQFKENPALKDMKLPLPTFLSSSSSLEENQKLLEEEKEEKKTNNWLIMKKQTKDPLSTKL